MDTVVTVGGVLTVVGIAAAIFGALLVIYLILAAIGEGFKH